MTQALHLANGETVNEKLRAENGIVAKILASKASDDQVIDDLFVSALSRGPTDAERERLVKIDEVPLCIGNEDRVIHAL